MAITGPNYLKFNSTPSATPSGEAFPQNTLGANAVDGRIWYRIIDGGATYYELAMRSWVTAGFQPLDATLTALAGVTTAANKLIYATGSDAFSTTDLTAAAMTVLDDATVGAMLDTLGGTAHTGTGAVVCATSPTLVTPVLGTPSSGTLTNCTGLPIGSGVSGLAANVATFLATPSSANLIAAVTDETGSGALVFASAPTLTNPVVGTQSANDNSTKAASTSYVDTASSHHKFSLAMNTGASVVLTNQASGAQFFGNTIANLTKIDLAHFTQVRLVAMVNQSSASANTPKLRAVYGTSLSAPPVIGDLTADIGTSEVSCSMASVGVIVTSWINIATSAKADVYVAIEQSGGDAAADPRIGMLMLEFRGDA